MELARREREKKRDLPDQEAQSSARQSDYLASSRAKVTGRRKKKEGKITTLSGMEEQSVLCLSQLLKHRKKKHVGGKKKKKKEKEGKPGREKGKGECLSWPIAELILSAFPLERIGERKKEKKGGKR